MSTRVCANGERCVAYPSLGEPAKLSRYNTLEVCEACHEHQLDQEIAAQNQPPESSAKASRRRRRNGAGSAPLKRADGRWQVRYTDKSGKRRSLYARTELMARVRLAAAVAERDAQNVTESVRAALDFDPEELLELADALEVAEKRLRRVAWLLYGTSEEWRKR